MAVTLAFYKGTLAENDHAKLFDRAVCWRTGGRFSHVEIVLGPIPGSRLSLCMSSSVRDSGVRIKGIDLTTGRWELVQIEGNSADTLLWFTEHLGQPYDALGLLVWVFPWRLEDRSAWFCSEACAAALGLPRSWSISPNDLYRWTQPGDCLLTPSGPSMGG
jgi:hypothetical protein